MGILRRVPHSRLIVYELTPYGRELEPVVLALGAWGFKAMGDPREEQIITPDAMTISLRTAFRPLVAASLPATAYAARLGPAELLIRVDGSTLDVTRGDGPADLAFATGPGIRWITILLLRYCSTTSGSHLGEVVVCGDARRQRSRITRRSAGARR